MMCVSIEVGRLHYLHNRFLKKLYTSSLNILGKQEVKFTVSITTYKGKHPSLGNNVFIDESARVIGEVVLGDDVSIWPMSVARGDINRIEIGARANIQDGSILHVTHDGEHSPGGHPLLIGADVTVGHRVILHGCRIGNHCLIGMGAVVMDGAVIEDEVMLGAGALVPPGKRLESGYLYVGAPARQARALTDEEKAYLRYSPDYYVQLKNEYLKALNGAPIRAAQAS
jgi:carbonic anhydrase/acetyltransferase-like protein (isoleucine patch superfamily)